MTLQDLEEITKQVNNDMSTSGDNDANENNESIAIEKEEGSIPNVDTSPRCEPPKSEKNKM